MRKFKKIMAAAAAAVMTLAMTVSAFADASISKGDPNDTHKYNVYQIFTGEPVGTEGTELTNVRLGQNAEGYDSSKSEQTALTTDQLRGLNETSGEGNIRTAVMAYFNTTTKDSPYKVVEVATDATATLVPGYYLIVDSTEIGSTDNDSYNFDVIRVATNSPLTIAKKRDVPTVEKYIDNGTAYDKTADYARVDDIPFRIIGTLPDATTYARYDTYYYKFTDKLTNMAVNTSTLTVKVYPETITNTEKNLSDTNAKVLDLSDTTNIEKNANNQDVSVTIKNTKAVKLTDGTTYAIQATDKIVMEYNAKFTDTATVNTPNPNEVDLTYSNDPTKEHDGETVPSTGKTPKEYAFAFTYELDITKVDKTNASKKLEATFILSKGSGESQQFATVANGKLTGWVNERTNATQLTTTGGKFIVNGLDQGVYQLIEVTPPNGYVALQPFNLTINATTVYNSETKSASLTHLALTSSNTADVINKTSTTPNGTVAAEVQNTPKSSLPTTGGIGTKLFYIVGGAMMFAAAALLVVKKLRRNA